jgi:membrane-bound lytic murein transglycosylase B
MRIVRWAIFLGAVICSTPVYAARCGGDFNTFVAAMSQEAAAAGISQAVISQALSGVTQDPAVLAFDRRQRGTFNKSFEQYVSTRVGPGRINIGRQMLQRHGSLLSRIEKQFRRAAGNCGRDLGAGERFRQGRHRQDAGHPHARHHGA